MVMDADNRVYIFLAQGTYKVVSTFLHLWVGTLNGVKLNAVAVAACVYRRNASAAETDAIIVAPTTTTLLPFCGSFFRQSRFVP